MVEYRKVNAFWKQVKEHEIKRDSKLWVVIDHSLHHLASQDGMFTVTEVQ